MFETDKIGIISDLHFGKNKSEQWEKIYNDFLSFLIKEYKDRGITEVLILGDIFDGHASKTKEKGISFRILNHVKSWFDELSRHFKVVLFSGNHDTYYKNRCDVSACSIFRNSENITLVEKTTDFSHGDMSYKIAPWACDFGDDKVDGLFCHLDIQTFKLNAVKKSTHGFTSGDLFKISDKVWSGHYHHYQTRDYAKGKKCITYVGTPLQLDWSESGKESYLHVFDLTKNELVEKIENTVSPKHVKYKASKLNKEVGNDFVEVIWDIKDDDEGRDQVDAALKGSEYKAKFNRSNLLKATQLDFSKASESINDIEILEKVIENMSETKPRKKEILAKFQHYYKIVT